MFTFISNGNLAGTNDDCSGVGNAEVYVGSFSGSSVSNIRQVTRTRFDSCTDRSRTVNFLSPGRRLSRDGRLLAFESLATDPKGNGANNAFAGVFVCSLGSDTASDTFVLVGPRALTAPGDLQHFPTFTDYTGLAPGTVIFTSALNFLPSGVFPDQAHDADGLNPQRSPQIFATQLPVSTSSTFTRVTNIPTLAIFGGLRPLASATLKRTAFSLVGDLGGGNADGSSEIFYLLSPQANTENAAVLSFFTGASNMPVATATPLPSPTPTPTPSPSPSPGVGQGLAPGELSIIRSTVALAPANTGPTTGSETRRAPDLPVELNGVSVSVNGAAAGLYFVGNSPQQINFVVPRSVTTGVAKVIINNNGTVLRGFVLIVAAQPDVFSTTADAGGRAIAVNVTNPASRTGEPFPTQSLDMAGNLVPTVLELSLTGARGVATSEVKITIGTTDITGTSITFVGPNTEMPGFDIINFVLPATLSNAGDLPIVVTVTRSSAVFTSRPPDTAPHVTIGP